MDEVLRQGAEKVEKDLGYEGLFKDTLRPSRRRSWQSYFLDQPPLGGEVMAMTGIHGLTFVTTHDARAMWGTPFDTPEKVDYGFALRQTSLVAGLIRHLAETPQLHDDLFPRVGIAEINGNAKFLRHGELFADKPAPGTVLLGFQGPARFYAIVDHMGKFHLRGLADKKHTYHKVIFEGYKFDESGNIIWAIDKKQTGKSAYRTKMFRRHMETDLIMFACNGITLFNLLEPRTFRNFHKGANHRWPPRGRPAAVLVQPAGYLDFILSQRLQHNDGVSGNRHTTEIDAVRHAAAQKNDFAQRQ